MDKQYIIIVTSTEAQDLRTHKVAQNSGDKGKALRIKAKAGETYQLVEVQPGQAQSYAPQQVKVKRVGKDLVITFEGGSQPDIIIEGYYDVMAKDHKGLIGLAEDGNFYEYIPEDPHPLGMVQLLPEGGQDVAMALGAGEIIAPAEAVIAAYPLLGALGLLGVVGAAANKVAPTPAIDTTPPAAPAADVAASSDTGSSNTDNNTSDNTPTISGGSATPGDIITVVMPGTGEVLTTVVAQDGTWSVTPTQTLSDGPQNVSVTATDPAGNVSAPTLVPVVIDTTPPAAPAVDIPEALNGINDTEAANGVQLTVTLPNDVVAGDVVTTVVLGPNNETITLTHTLTAADITAGHIIQTVPYSTINPTGNTFLDGNWTTSSTITDAAGNVSPAMPDSFVLSANAPVITIAAIATDDIINAAEASGAIPVTGTTSAEPGQTVTITLNGRPFTGTVQPDGTYTINVPVAYIPSDGSYTIAADVSSASGTPAVQAQRPLTVDTTAPVITISSIAGDAISGSTVNGTFDAAERGALNSNAVTTAPVISGTTDAEAGQIVTITLNGQSYTATVQSGGSWSITVSNADALALNHGSTYAVTAMVSDAAGNNATPDTDNQLIVNIAPPDVPTVVEQYTGDHTPTIVGRAMKQIGVGSNNTPIYDNLNNGDVLNVTVNGVTYNLTVGQTSSPTGLSYSNGTWSLAVQNNIPNGNYEVAVSVTAGGVTKTDISTTELHINDVPPAITLNPISDGVINQIESTQSLPISGTTDAPVGSTVTVTINGQSYTATVESGGVFTITVPGTAVAALLDGTQTATASVTNQYGVTGTDTENVLVDTTPPAAPVADVAASSDTGISNTDNNTADTTPTISGTGTPGDTITVVMQETGEVLTATVASNGTWSVTPTQALPEGPQNASVTATDPAGNVSAPTLVPVVIDTTAPAAPAADVAASSDTGSSNTDNITSDNTPTISGGGATPGDTITVVMPGTGEVLTTVVAQDGTWSVTPTQTLSDGTQNVTVTATDPAGNVSAPTQVPVTIDTTPPVAPVADVAASSDTGLSNTDNNTSDRTPTITGTGSPGDTITVTFPTGEVQTTTVAQDGSWSVTPVQSLPNGSQNVSVTATDPAGNVSPTTQVPVVIDTTPPNAPVADVAASSDTGSSNTDNITSDNTPTITGTGVPGQLITVTMPGTNEVVTAVVAQDGTWSATPTQALSDGTQNVTVTATDAAGNVSAPTTVPVTIDTTAPVITITSIAGDSISGSTLNGTFDAAERGALNSNAVTTAPVISGTTDAEAGQIVTMTLNGLSYTATVQNGGAWSVTLPDADAVALQHGSTYAITATVSDKAGNTSSDIDNGLVVNIAPPDIPTVVSQYTANHTPTITGAAQKADPNVQGAYINLAAGDVLTVTVDNVTYQLTIGQPSSPTGLSYDATTGVWSLSPSVSIANGDYEVAVSVTAANVTKTDISSTELHINDAVPQITLSPISGGTINAAESNQQLPISGTTNAPVGETVTVTLNGHTYTAIVQAGANGQPNTFVVNVPAADVAAITDGTQTATASVTNRYGVTGTDSEDVIVDTTAPSAPAADVAASSDTGSSNTDNITSDRTPTISGSGATPGDTITVTMPGTGEVLTTVVAQDGTWSATPTQSLPEGGPQNVSVTATDPAGNVSAATQVPVTIDTTPPAAPAADVAASSDTGSSNTDNITSDRTPTISGSGATPGDTITVTMPGTGEVLTTVVAQDGTWSATPTQSLPEGGPQNVSVTATDPAGNVSAATQVPVTIDTTPPAAPAADVAASSDTGSSNTDNITSDTTPTITGSGATPGDTITVTTPTGEVITTTVDSNGNWSATPTQALPEGGPQNVSVTATDPAGNVSAATQVPVTIDTTAPAAPAADVAASSDTGVSNTDNITSDTTPTITGSGATPGDTITVTTPTGEVITTTVDSNGNWSATPTQALPEGGPQNVSVTATDPAGNVSAATQVPVTIDTTPPAAPAADVAASSDTGSSNTDNITSDTTPTITGSGATPGDTITVTTPTGEVITTTVDQNGNWSATPTQALPEGGPQNVTVTATDTAGNVSPASTVPVTIDTTAPAAPAAVLDPASDSGVAGDGKTNDATPTISGTGTPGDKITVTTPTGEVITTTVDQNGNWSATPTQALPEGGPQNVTITATDPAGNVSAATQVPVTIDTTPPAAPAADVAASSDTGSSNTDNITSDTTPTITGSGATPGDTITVTTPTGEVITTTVDQNGNWSATPTQALPEGGPQNVTVTATDTAGNVSPASTVPVTIDTTAPAVPTVTSGTANTLQPTISGGASLATGDTLTVTVNGATYIVDPANLATGITFTNGTWSIDTATAVPVSGTLAAFTDGQTYDVTATATDAAGNSSIDTSNSELTINTSLPSVSVPEGPVVNAAEATSNGGTPVVTRLPAGAQAGDTITTVVTKPDGTTMTLTRVLDATDIANRQISQNIPTADLTQDGSWTTSTTLTPQGGSAGQAVSGGFTLDATPPAAPAADVAAGSDTGSSNTDNITSDTTPTISGSGATPGDTITVTMPGTNEVVTAIVDSNGNWSATPTQALPEGGPQNVTVTATDPAGNVSAPTTVPVTIDTTAPAISWSSSVPVTDNVAGGTVGTLTSGAITNDNTPTLTFTAEAGSSVKVYDGNTLLGTATEGPAGTFTFTPSSPLAEGAHSFTATATDPAGNTSAPTTAFPLVIDTTAPAAPAADVAVASDTGSSNTDNITSDNTPTISGTGTPGQTITVTMPGTNEVVTTTVDANGNWSVTPTQALSNGGPQNVSVTATDAAGNVSAPTQVPVIIDTTAPAAPAAVLDPASDSGVAGDGITNDNTPTISGSGATPGDTITVTMPTGEIITTTVDSNGNWSATPTQALPEGGPQNVSVTATDPAGNVSAATQVPVTIDTTAPAAPAGDVAAGSDTGASNTDNITSDNTPEITGSGATPGDLITLYAPDGTTPLGSATVAPNGTWSITPNAPLAEGPQNLGIDATDPAGNVSPRADVPVTIDTTAPAAPAGDVAAGSDTGASNTDNITSDTTPEITGSGATPGDLITLYAPDGTTPLGSATVAPDGTWSITPNAPLAEGPQNLSISATDPAGNVSPRADVPVTIDTTAPAVPTVTSGTANTLHPVISGTATVAPGETLTVTVNGATYTVVPNAQGQWSIDTLTAAPVSGTLAAFVDGQTYSVTVTTTDAAGNSSTDTSSSELTINTTAPDTTPPAAPVLTLANDNVAGGTVGSLSSGATTNDNTPTFTFTAEPGSTVKVYDGGTLLGTATEDPNNPGVFTFTPSNPLSEGSHTITATSTDAANNVSAPSNSFPLIVDTTVPTASGALTATAPNDSGTLGDNITNDTTPSVSGTTEANAAVSVVINGQTYTTTADANGNWSVTTGTLSDGPYTPVITVTDEAGNSTTANGTPFTVDNTPPVVPAVDALSTPVLRPTITGTATVSAGEVLTVTVNGATYTVDTANPGTGITYNSSTGVWSIDTATATPASGFLGNFAAGQTYSVTATTTDAAGNASTDTTTSELVITGTPSVVGQLAASSDSGVQGDSTTNDTTPTISGTGVPGETVKLYAPDGTTLLGTATIAADGTWSITPNTTLTDGPQNLIAKSFAPGNTTATPDSTSTIAVTIDTAAGILITSIAGDAVAATGNGNFGLSERGFDTTTYTLNSTVTTPPVIGGTVTNADVGSTVTITLNGKTYTTTVQAGSTWSYTLSDADAKLLNHGNTYAITASVVDAAANTGTDNNNGVDINIAPPDVPTVVNQFNLSTKTPNISGTADKIDNQSNTIHLETGDILTVVLKDAAGTTTLATYTLTVGADNVTTGTGGSGVNLNTELSYDKTSGIWTLGGGNGIPANVFTHAGAYNVDVTTSVPDGSTRLLRNDVSSQEITIAPTAPTINATLWAATGAGNTSSLTGVGEANYAADSATFVTTGTVDSVLWNSEFVGNGTVVRVQLPTTGTVPPVAGDVMRLNWGGTDIDVTLTGAMITAKYVDVTVPEATIRTAGYGDINVTAQIIGGGVSSALASQTVTVAFDLPLALPADPTSPSYGFVVNGAGPSATVFGINNTRDAFGSGATNMGDMNGDGLDDYIVGDNINGKMYVVFGQSGLTQVDVSAVAAGTGGFVIDAISGSGVTYGADKYSLLASADFNGDGLNDVAMALNNTNANATTANVFVVYGKTDISTVHLYTMAASQGFKINSSPLVNGAGWSGLGSKAIAYGGTTYQTGSGSVPNNIGLTSAGDVNGDGFEDFVMGLNMASPNGVAPQAGRAFVMFGASSAQSTLTLPYMSASYNATLTNGFFIEGNNAVGIFTGTAVGGGGDVNGDGLDDLVVSSNATTTVPASVFVVYGKNDGTAVNISSLTGNSVTGGFRITDAAQTTSSSGAALTVPAGKTPSAQLLGDVNGDGLADIAVGQYDRAVVVFGKNDTSAVSASAIAAGTSTQGFVIQGDSVKTGAFGFMVNAGDMNGDGLADMVLATHSNHAYIVFGQTAGGVTIDLTRPDITKFVPVANEAYSNAQSVISSVGDVNGDGFDDIVIGVPSADPASGGQEGKAYVVYGGFSDVTSAVFQVSNGDVIGTTGNDTISGSSGANQLVGGAGDDVFTGNGGADVMYGGAGNDSFVLNADNVAMLARNSGNTSQGVARINGGNGIDTIKLDGTSSLDLTQVQNAVIDGVERFNLNGNSSSLTLGLVDVIQLAQDNNAFNTDNGWTATSSGGATGWGAVNRYAQAVVDGDATNVLTLRQGWTNIGNVEHTEGGITTVYKVLQSNSAAAQVLVANNVQLRMSPSVLTSANELASGLNHTEALSGSGTPVRVSLADTGAVAGNTLELNWGGQIVTYTVTAQDLANGYADVLVGTSALTAVTPVGTTGNVAASVTLLDDADTVSQSDPVSVAVNFLLPTAPTINATLWAATGAGNTSSRTGVGEANYAADSTSFVTTGAVDGVLWNSEFIGNGTVVRVQLPTTSTVPPVAGDTVRLNWGGTDLADVTLTSAMITAKYVDITVSEATIRTAGYGDVDVTAQIIKAATGNGSLLASQAVTVAFNLPLALPADPTSPSYGFVVNGAGPQATVTAINNNRDAFGGGVTNMGDLNGDGFDDYAVSDSGNSNIYVVFGQSGNQRLDVSSISAGLGGGYMIDAGTTLGYGPYWNVASSDVNGDGLNDLMVGLTLVGNDVRTDSAYVIYGKSTTAAIALSTIENGTTPALGFKFRDANIPNVGTSTYSSIGGRSATSGGGGSPANIGITSAGDVNGDGFEDFIFGEPTVLTTGWTATEPGRAFVLFGTAAGYTNTLLPIMSSNPTSMTNGFFINGNTSFGLQLGNSVGGGGDVNGDGLDDLVVATAATSSKTASVFVTFGKANGNTVNISSMTSATGTDGFQITDAAQTTNSQGAALAAPANDVEAQLIGDVNGDGLADIAIAQYDRAVIVFGKASGASVSASAIAAGTSTGGFVIQGNSAATGAFGNVVEVGDMNGDGLADMLVSTGSSQAYLVFGQTASQVSINLTAPDITKFVPIANEIGSVAQSSTTKLGDINGDGFDDLMIGISLADPASGVNEGKSYVVYGGFSDVTSAVFQVSNGDVIGTSGNDTINGTSGANQLVGGAGDDVFTGNGGADVMYGGAGNDTFVLNADNVAMLARNSGNTSQNIARVDGGTGLDTFKLDGNGLVLDLTAIRSDVISQVENLDITSGAGTANTVKLNAQDVLDMGDNNLFNVNTAAVDTRKQLMVTGDADDKVVLTDLTDWTLATGANSTFTSNGHTYDVYNHNTKALQLLIDDAILQSNITVS